MTTDAHAQQLPSTSEGRVAGWIVMTVAVPVLAALGFLAGRLATRVLVQRVESGPVDADDPTVQPDVSVP